MKDLFEIFIAFMKVGALTFGGGYAMLPILQRDIADKKKWATNEELTDYYAISQCLPGVIAVNNAMIIGNKQKGRPGMAAAALGVVFPSFTVIVVIAMFIENFIKYEIVQHAFNGVRVAVCVLVINAVIKMWKTGVKDLIGIIIFAASLAVSVFTNVSPVIPVIVGAACGILIKNKEEKVK